MTGTSNNNPQTHNRKANLVRIASILLCLSKPSTSSFISPSTTSSSSPNPALGSFSHRDRCLATKGIYTTKQKRTGPVIHTHRDMDSADSFPEGQNLAHELYEHVRIREFRAKLEHDPSLSMLEEDESDRRNRGRPNAKRGSKDFPTFASSLWVSAEIPDRQSRSIFNSGTELQFSLSGVNGSREKVMLDEMSLTNPNSFSEASFIVAFILVLLTLYLYSSGMTEWIADGAFADMELNFAEMIASAEEAAIAVKDIAVLI